MILKDNQMTPLDIISLLYAHFFPFVLGTLTKLLCFSSLIITNGDEGIQTYNFFNEKNGAIPLNYKPVHLLHFSLMGGNVQARPKKDYPHFIHKHDPIIALKILAYISNGFTILTHANCLIKCLIILGSPKL